MRVASSGNRRTESIPAPISDAPTPSEIAPRSAPMPTMATISGSPVALKSARLNVSLRPSSRTHVVASDLVGAVGETVRVLLARRLQEQLGGIGRATGDDDHVTHEPLVAAFALDHHLADGSTTVVRSEPHDLRVRHERDVRVLERRAHAEDLCVRLRVDETREAVARRTADARAERDVRFVEHDPARGVEGVVPGRREVVGELLDPRLV